jgi:chromosomal replication initiator protein
MAVYLARILTGASWNQIGGAIGGRDHTTAMHSFKRMAALVESNLEVFAKVDEIKRSLLDRRNGEIA